MSGNPSEDGSPSRKHRVSSMKAQADISTKLDAFFCEEISDGSGGEFAMKIKVFQYDEKITI